MSSASTTGQSPPRHTETPGKFSEAECQALASAILESQFCRENPLSSAFKGSSGFEVIFTREGEAEFRLRAPMLVPFFDAVTSASSNAFFVNVLVMGDGVQARPHLDCSLDPYLGGHRAPELVSLLYVQVPDDLEGGVLTLWGRPKDLDKSGRSGYEAEVTPMTGLLVQFDGEVVHSVSKVTTKSHRIGVIVEEYRLEEEKLALVPKLRGCGVDLPPRRKPARGPLKRIEV